LTYIKLYFTPFNLLINETSKDVDIWIQKRAEVDYRALIRTNPDDFIKFPIPEVVLLRIREWGRKAAEADRKIFNIMDKKKKQ